MKDLIQQLSKQDQKLLKLALVLAANGNMQQLDFMIRSANKRSLPILTKIKASL